MLTKLRFLSSVLALTLLTAPAWGQSKTKAIITNEINTLIPDNNQNRVVPADIRQVTQDMVASYQQWPLVNAQTGTSYILQCSDMNALVTFNNANPVSVTLPSAATTCFGAGWNVKMENTGIGAVTVTPVAGLIGGASNLVLLSNQASQIFSDSVNYQIFLSATGTSSGITVLHGDVAATGPGNVPATVQGIQGVSVSATPPTTGQTLTYNGLIWAPSTPAGTGTVTTINQGTGMSLSTNPCTVTCTVALGNTAVSAATYGSPTAIPSFTVNAQGQLTAASNNVVIAPAGTLTGTGLASNVVTSNLTSVGALSGGSTAAGFTLNVGVGGSTIAGIVPAANLPLATSSTFGAVEPDNSTITVSAGVISSTGGVSLANPTGTIGLTAVNGVAITAPRSDSAPALSQAISPTWSGNHTFTNNIIANGGIKVAASGYANFGTTAGSSGYGIRDNSGVMQGANSGNAWANVAYMAGTPANGNCASWTTVGTLYTLVDNGSACGSGGGGGSTTAVVQDFLAGSGFTFNSTTQLTLSSAPYNASALNIYFDGVLQNHNTWCLSGSTVSFGTGLNCTVTPTPIQATSVVEAAWFTTGAGGLTSVGLSDASTTPIYTVGSSPLTANGTLTLTLNTEAKNLVFAGPTTGANAQPTFRALVAADIPLATSSVVGGVKGDGSTLAISGSGVISCTTGTSSQLGCLKPDGTIITVSSGAITVPKASNSVFGVVEVDNTTITASGGVISAVGSTLTIGAPISGSCTGGYVVYNSGTTGSPVVGCELLAGGGNVSNFGTPSIGQLATWTDATHVQGVTALPAANMPVLAGDVTSAGATLTTAVAKIAGTTVSGTTGSTNVVFSASPTLTGTPAAPTQSLGDVTTDIATDQFVANAFNAFDYKNPVVAATTAALTVVYNNGTSGVGATLTNAGAKAAFALDGVSLSVGNRVLVKNQATTFQNGLYTVSTVGDGSTNWVLTRTTDYDLPAQINLYSLVPVITGSVNAGSAWTQNATVSTIGSDPISFIQSVLSPTQVLQVANNLSELSGSPSTARSNLGLGTAAIVNTGTSGATVPLLNSATANVWTSINTWPTGDVRIIGTSTGYTALASANTSATNYTQTFQATNDTVAGLSTAGQAMSGGVHLTSHGYTTGSITIDCGFNPVQYVVNGGAFTLTAPANDGTCLLMVRNNATAGAITFSGFTVGSNTGDALTTTSGNLFTISVWRITDATGSVAGYRVAAMQ